MFIFDLERGTGARAADGVKFCGLGCAQGECVEAVHAQNVHVAVARQVEADYHDKVGQDEDGSFEVVALTLAIDVR